MNKHDEKELAKRMAEGEFQDWYIELIRLRHRKYPDVRFTIKPLTRRQAEGQGPRVFRVAVGPRFSRPSKAFVREFVASEAAFVGRPAEDWYPTIFQAVDHRQVSEVERLERAREFLAEVGFLARRLARCLPESKWDYWQAVFEDIALGGTGYVPHQGGRPIGSRTWRNREEFVTTMARAARALNATGRRLTQEKAAQYCRHHVAGFKGLKARQIRRWTKDYGFENWGELLELLETWP